jgi:hypothetical protein
MSDDRDTDSGLNDSAAMAAQLLRAEVPVRSEWRSALLARVQYDTDAERSRNRWTIRPVVAIAASILLLALGALGASLVQRLSPRPTLVASVPSAPPVVRFVYVAPRAAHVSVVGDFNQWNPTAVPLRRLNDGTWIADVPLVPGRYAYAFVVDGKLEVDPTAPRAADGDFGIANSIVMVRGL